MKYFRKFLISAVAGAGSAVGAFIAKECMKAAKNEYEQHWFKKKSKKGENLIPEKDEES